MNPYKRFLDFVHKMHHENEKEDYENRLVELTEIKTIAISTVFTHDCGFETAICQNEHAHPVERYENREEAVLGHKRWVNFIKTGGRKIIKLNWGFLDDPTIVELE